MSDEDDIIQPPPAPADPHSLWHVGLWLAANALRVTQIELRRGRQAQLDRDEKRREQEVLHQSWKEDREARLAAQQGRERVWRAEQDEKRRGWQAEQDAIERRWREDREAAHQKWASETAELKAAARMEREQRMTLATLERQEREAVAEKERLTEEARARRFFMWVATILTLAFGLGAFLLMLNGKASEGMSLAGMIAFAASGAGISVGLRSVVK